MLGLPMSAHRAKLPCLGFRAAQSSSFAVGEESRAGDKKNTITKLKRIMYK